MVEVKLPSQKVGPVKTVLPVTVRTAKTQSGRLNAVFVVNYIILFLGLVTILVTVNKFRYMKVENKCLKSQVERIHREKAVLEKCIRKSIARERLAQAAINLVETDLLPFLKGQEEEKVSVSWFAFFWSGSPDPEDMRLDMAQLVKVLDAEIYNVGLTEESGEINNKTQNLIIDN